MPSLGSHIKHFIKDSLQDNNLAGIESALFYQSIYGRPNHISDEIKEKRVVLYTYKPSDDSRPFIETKVTIELNIKTESVANNLECTSDLEDCAVCKERTLMWFHPKHSIHRLCHDCLKRLVYQENKCPICRGQYHSEQELVNLVEMSCAGPFLSPVTLRSGC